MEMFGNKKAATVVGSAADASIEDRMAFLKKVYGLLTLTLISAVAGAYVGAEYLSPAMMIPLFIGNFIVLLIAMWVRRKPGLNLVAMFAFTSISGVTLGPVMLMYDVGLIQEALGLTVIIFASLTFYVIASKKDFSFLGSFLITGIIIFIIGSLLNVFFFQYGAMEFILLCGGVLLFSGFILYDTSNILRHYDVEDYTSATLALYLDILNLFLILLRLLGMSRD